MARKDDPGSLFDDPEECVDEEDAVEHLKETILEDAEEEEGWLTRLCRTLIKRGWRQEN